MTVQQISKDALMGLFIESGLKGLFSEALPETAEENIPKLPKERQKEAREKLKALKDNPPEMFTETDKSQGNGVCPENGLAENKHIDYESEAYKNFAKIIQNLTGYFEQNKELIENSYKKFFSAIGIKLVVN